MTKMLKSLFVSRVRGKLLKIFLNNQDEMYHVRGLVRKSNEEINAVRRELARMEKYGLVKKEPRGNRLYYWFNKKFVFYPELTAMIAKVTGLGGELIKNKNKLGKVKFVMFSGRFICGLPREDENEVELLVVGQVVMPELVRLIKQEEAKREQEINYTVMDENEFSFRKKRRDPFILEILSGSRVMILGNEEALVA